MKIGKGRGTAKVWPIESFVVGLWVYWIQGAGSNLDWKINFLQRIMREKAGKMSWKDLECLKNDFRLH